MSTIRLLILPCLILLSMAIHAQSKYISKTGKISFTAIEDRTVNATTKSASVLADVVSKEIQFSVLVKSFDFEKALMQEKFNNKILQSEIYPTAEFKGLFSGKAGTDFNKPGVYEVSVTGQLTMHGVTNTISTAGTITNEQNSLLLNASFSISIADYKISNPGIGNGVISITVDCRLKPM